jgi:glycosyltransferase involved in cell wall biosynthesis
VPQILLSRNALYLSTDFMRDVRKRGDYRLWIDTQIKGVFARRSVQVADCAIAPSAVFAEELRRWTGRDVRAIHHGFDHEAFLSESIPLSHQVLDQIQATEGSLRILFVSHYNYYRNFETLIRALAILKRNLHPRPARLMITCKLASNANPGSYQPESAANLVHQLELREEIVELDAVPYRALHNLYRECDVYVTPAYAETFAHPLVEAMASGLPVIASDLPVHREICGEAARYFPRFSPEALAERIVQICGSSEEQASMRALGLIRSQDFSWNKHVDAILAVAQELHGSTAK